MKVQNLVELTKAMDNGENNIEITRSFLINTPLILKEGASLKGVEQENGELPTIMFENSDGIGLTSNNEIKDINIQVVEKNRAIFNRGIKEDLGRYIISNVKTQGQVSIIMYKPSKKLDVEINGLHVLSADTRHYLEQPQKYGVNVLQGALTVYNFNGSEDSLINFKGEDIKIGAKNLPVIGSGVFLSGFSDDKGKMEIEYLRTGDVYSTGHIPFGVADIITAGIFIVFGAHAKEVTHNGEVITYGVNDMVLDTWGTVDKWVSNKKVISYGPSGVGFVNFGTVKEFIMNDDIQTYGLGARGYNQYDGTLEKGVFKNIKTFGNGSVGVQISKKVGDIEIDGSIETKGGIGNTLVKGVNVELPAYALSIKEGGFVNSFKVSKDIITNGDDLVTFIKEEGGDIKDFDVRGEIKALGNNSKKEDFVKKA